MLDAWAMPASHGADATSSHSAKPSEKAANSENQRQRTNRICIHRVGNGLGLAIGLIQGR
jgi:hypothetical protein